VEWRSKVRNEDISMHLREEKYKRLKFIDINASAWIYGFESTSGSIVG
jgi:hypothetical protein